MRVTKTVREYIEKQVRLKIEPKYEVEKKEAERQNEIFNNLAQKAQDTAIATAMKILKEGVADYDFLSINSRVINFYGLPLQIKDEHKISSVHCWQTRMSQEIQEKVDDIIVNLELGGNKDDLDRMLAEL